MSAATTDLVDANVVDANVATVALRNVDDRAQLLNKAVILTDDPEDLERLVRASGHEAVVVTV